MDLVDHEQAHLKLSRQGPDAVAQGGDAGSISEDAAHWSARHFLYQSE